MSSSFSNSFARNLRDQLDKAKLSQTDLAVRLGVNKSSVSEWLAGKKWPRMEKIDAMCSIFGCRRADLLDDHADQLSPDGMIREIFDIIGKDAEMQERVLKFARFLEAEKEEKRK